MTARRCLYIIFYLSAFVPLNSRAQGPMQPQPEPRFDDRVLLDLQNHRTPAQTDIFLFLSRTNNYVDFGIPAGLLIAGAINHDQAMRQNALFVASSSAVSFGVTTLIKVIVKRRRPFLQNTNLKPVYRAGDFSFPSGHTSSSFVTATSLSMAYPKWYVIAPVFLWAGSVSYSRMYLGEHYPTDVGAGAAIGVGSALSMSFLRK